MMGQTMQKGKGMKIPGFIVLRLIVFVWWSSVGWAQLDVAREVLACTTVNTSEERLTCYDAVAAALTQPVESNLGNWQVSVDTNPIDDTKTVVLTNVATEGTGEYGDPVTLYLRCKSGVIEAFVAWDSYIGGDSVDVTYRIGTSPAKTDKWYPSSDKTATFFSLYEKYDRQFVKDLAASDNGSLVVQVSPYNENPITAIFGVAGLNEILPQLYEPCPE